MLYTISSVINFLLNGFGFMLMVVSIMPKFKVVQFYRDTKQEFSGLYARSKIFAFGFIMFGNYWAIKS